MHAIDTLQYTEDLKAAGMTDSQAQAMARAHDAFFQNLIDTRLATKDDLKTEIAELRTELKGDIAELRAEFKSDIAALRTELKGDIAALRTELKGDIAALRTEMYRQTITVIIVLGALMTILNYFH